MITSRTSIALRSSTIALRQRHSLPQTLILFVTSRCNARCAFCLYKDSVDNPTRRSDELTVDEIDRIARRYGPLHYLALSGGEPFVRNDIAELCQPFIDHCGTSVIDIPSNFYFGDAMAVAVEHLAARNPDVLVELQLSLDHLGERHDVSRGVDGLFDRAIESARRMQSIRARHPNLSLKLNVVWLETNCDEIQTILDELDRTLEFDRTHLTYPHRQMPTEGGTPDDLADFDRFRAVAERVAGRARGRLDPFSLPMRAAKVSSHRVLRSAITGDQPMGRRCEAGHHLVVIDERGEVYPCEILWSPVGNVRTADYDVGAVLTGEAMREFRDERLGGTTPCNCTWSCAAMTAVSVTPSLYPRLAADAASLAIGRSNRR